MIGLKWLDCNGPTRSTSGRSAEIYIYIYIYIDVFNGKPLVRSINELNLNLVNFILRPYGRAADPGAIRGQGFFQNGPRWSQDGPKMAHVRPGWPKDMNKNKEHVKTYPQIIGKYSEKHEK